MCDMKRPGFEPGDFTVTVCFQCFMGGDRVAFEGLKGGTVRPRSEQTVRPFTLFSSKN